MQEYLVDQAGYRAGVELFNRGEFFDAHEVLEDVWREAPAPEKKFLQGLIQVAVAFHHYSTGNRVGALSLLARGQKNLMAESNHSYGIALPPLFDSLNSWRQALAGETLPPPLPKLDLRQIDSQ